MRFWLMAALAAVTVLVGTKTAEAADRCKLQMFSADPVRSTDGRIIIAVMLGDRPARFILDTGAVWSTIRSSDTDNMARTPAGRIIRGVAGDALTEYVQFPSMKIGPGEIKDQRFLVSPDKIGGFDQVDGVLGADFLSRFDLELDISNNIVNFFLHAACGDRVVYWENTGFVTIPLENDRNGYVRFDLELDGKSLRGLFDTGASASVLNLKTAEDEFGLTPYGPGVEASQDVASITGQTIPAYMHQFNVLDFGGIKLGNPWIELVANKMGGSYEEQPQLVIGVHQLRQLHVYIAYKDKELYATASMPRTAPAAKTANAFAVRKLDVIDRQLIAPFETNAQKHLHDKQPDLALADLDEIIRRYPDAQLGYLQRAEIEMQTGRQDAALTDFARAVTADPDSADAYERRSRFLRLLHRAEEALADDAKAAELAPRSAEGYRARALERRINGDVPGAIADYGRLIELHPGDAASYKEQAVLFEAVKDYSHALSDFDKALSLTTTDASLYTARGRVRAHDHQYALAIEDATRALDLAPASSQDLEDRCYYRAILGQADLALEDCNAVVDMMPKNSVALSGRAFVRMKQNRFSDAIDDYDQALRLNPKLANPLYGRGLAKRAVGDAKGGSEDILAAQKLEPSVADWFGK